MEKSRILFVTQEITPFLSESNLAETVRKISQGVHEKDKEIRIFMPRFGVVNERRHQLHEVIRLSGMNLIVDDTDHPLIIKVASIPQARIQVYFIDNEEFFKRKRVFNDENGKLAKDNDERAIFFCRGVAETVKKLGWSPDIVHCHGWMTAFMPLYLKNMYNDDPHFTTAKTMFSVYGSGYKGKLSKNILNKLAFDGIPTEDLVLKNSPDSNNVNMLGVQFADVIGIGDQTINTELLSYIENSGKPILGYQDEDSLVEAHQEFYDKVLTENGVLAE
jgi:starch synthase